jgi:hypothetical protein
LHRVGILRRGGENNNHGVKKLLTAIFERRILNSTSTLNLLPYDLADTCTMMRIMFRNKVYMTNNVHRFV